MLEEATRKIRDTLRSIRGVFGIALFEMKRSMIALWLILRRNRGVVAWTLGSVLAVRLQRAWRRRPLLPEGGILRFSWSGFLAARLQRAWRRRVLLPIRK